MILEYIFENFVGAEILKHSSIYNIEVSYWGASMEKEARFALENNYEKKQLVLRLKS